MTSKTDPQDHTGLTGVLSNIATRLQTTEALHPVVSAQNKPKKKTNGCDRLSPMAQRVILLASATNGTFIPTLTPPILRRFLNKRNKTSLQDDCSLTYAGNNLYLPTYFFQALLQGHILEIPDLDAPTGLSPIITPPSSVGSVNAHQWAMRIQVLLSMGQDCLSK